MEGFHGRWRAEFRCELAGQKLVEFDLGVVGMKSGRGTGWSRHSGNSAVLREAPWFGAHLIDVRGAERVHPPAVPGVGRHDVMNARLFELVQNRRFYVPELGPPAVLPDPVTLFR